MSGFDLGEIARKFERGFSEYFAQLGITLEVQAPALPLPINGDDLSAFRCLLNLAMNAKDAVRRVEKRKGRIVIKTWAECGFGMLSVSDNGPGWSDGPLPFTNQWVRANPLSGRGHGLLVIDKSVKALNGSIECVSYLGKGTLFTLKLPLASEEKTGASVTLASATPLEPSPEV